MNKLTVGYLEDKLRKFPKETEIYVSCGCCHHSSVGSTDIIDIEDYTDQTFGYIELKINDSIESDIKLSKNKEEFYKAEIKKLEKEKEQIEYELFKYKNKLETIYNISKQ